MKDLDQTGSTKTPSQQSKIEITRQRDSKSDENKLLLHQTRKSLKQTIAQAKNVWTISICRTIENTDAFKGWEAVQTLNKGLTSHRSKRTTPNQTATLPKMTTRKPS